MKERITKIKIHDSQLLVNLSNLLKNILPYSIMGCIANFQVENKESKMEMVKVINFLQVAVINCCSID